MSSSSSISSVLGSSSNSAIDLSSLLQAATGATSTGIDVNAAVAAAIYAARAPERQWQTQQATLKSQISALTSIQTAVAQVKTDLNDLNNLQGSLSARSVTSNSTSVTGTASASAATGVHTVSVQSLATAASWYSPATPGANSTLGTSTLTITASGGQQTTFTTGSGINSLSALASAINSSSAGVNASVVTDASGARLALVGANTGSAADFSVTYGTAGASSWSSTTVASASTGLAAGSFQVGDGSTTATITVNAGDTLSDVANRINSQGLAVTASVTNTSGGVQLSIAPTASNTINVSNDPTFTLTRASTGTNASLTVDGIPLSNASNTVTGAVQGLTLNLQSVTASGSPASVNVTADTSTITNALSTFVSDYNTALSAVSSQFTYSTANGSQGALSGDSTMRALQSTLLAAGSYIAPSSSGGSGSSSSSGTVKTLADLGITMNDDGTLSLNSATLQSAAANPNAIQNFFQGASLNGFAASFGQSIDAYSNAATGSITNEVQNLNSQYTNLQSHISDYETGFIASQTTVLTAMYSKAEIALQQLPAQLKSIQAQLGSNSGS